MKKGTIVKIDWESFERHLNNTLEDQIKWSRKRGMIPDHPWITGMKGRFQELMKYKGETSQFISSYDGSYINLKFSDGFEFGCDRKFVYI